MPRLKRLLISLLALVVVIMDVVSALAAVVSVQPESQVEPAALTLTVQCNQIM